MTRIISFFWTLLSRLKRKDYIKLFHSICSFETYKLFDFENRRQFGAKGGNYNRNIIMQATRILTRNKIKLAKRLEKVVDQMRLGKKVSLTC